MRTSSEQSPVAEGSRRHFLSSAGKYMRTAPKPCENYAGRLSAAGRHLKDHGRKLMEGQHTWHDADGKTANGYGGDGGTENYCRIGTGFPKNDAERDICRCGGAARSSILIGEVAKILWQNGVDTGEKRLFHWMRQAGFLIRRKGTDYNMPTQRSMEMELFEIRERIINNPDGSIQITKTALVTGKGQQYLLINFRIGIRWDDLFTG